MTHIALGDFQAALKSLVSALGIDKNTTRSMGFWL